MSDETTGVNMLHVPHDPMDYFYGIAEEKIPAEVTDPRWCANRLDSITALRLRGYSNAEIIRADLSACAFYVCAFSTISIDFARTYERNERNAPSLFSPGSAHSITLSTVVAHLPFAAMLPRMHPGMFRCMDLTCCMWCGHVLDERYAAQ